jgi:hypothetical protein
MNEATNEIYGLTTDEDPAIAVFKFSGSFSDKIFLPITSPKK